MSYTTIEKIRSYLAPSTAVAERIYDLLLTIRSNEYITFFGGAVDSDSIRVKSLQTNDPVRKEIQFVDGSVSFSTTEIVRGSVVVASDSSLGTIYVENDDYIIDYENGTVTVKSASSIGATATCTIWYCPYHLYQVGNDYQIDFSYGKIKALSGGTIALNESVLIDFTPCFETFDDSLLGYAVTLANSLIERQIDPDQEFENDPALESAATYSALEIVCRAVVSRELVRSNANDKTASIWIKLADHYQKRTNELIRSFVPPTNSPAAPKLT